jgi:flagellar biosynthesis protein
MSNEKPALPLAVALQYDGKNAPRVTAKGRDKLAEQIIQVARQHGIPLQETISYRGKCQTCNPRLHDDEYTM